MTNTTNQEILTLLVGLKAKYGAGSTSVVNINIADAQTLATFVNGQTDPATALIALTIAMQNAAGKTQISDIITAATNFYNFIYEPDATTPATPAS